MGSFHHVFSIASGLGLSRACKVRFKMRRSFRVVYELRWYFEGRIHKPNYYFSLFLNNNNFLSEAREGRSGQKRKIGEGWIHVRKEGGKCLYLRWLRKAGMRLKVKDNSELLLTCSLTYFYIVCFRKMFLSYLNLLVKATLFARSKAEPERLRVFSSAMIGC